jgi:hypothetical protein
MPIQFFCAACRQPIEVDDVLAGRPVTCPYCGKVVTAPLSTDAGVRPLAEAAPPAEAGPTAPPVDTGGWTAPIDAPPPLPPASGGKLGWIALILAVGFVFSLAAFLLSTAATAAKELPPNPTREEITRFFEKRIEENPRLQALSVATICVVPILGICLAIAALVRRSTPRWPAITALALISSFYLLICLSAVLQAGMLAGRDG